MASNARRGTPAVTGNADLDKRLRDAGWSAPMGERLPIQKWTVGAMVVGVLLSTKKLPDSGGKTGGHLFTLAETDDAGDAEKGTRVCYGAPTLLWEILEPIPMGSVLMIRCTGKVPTKRGQDAWTFEVRNKGQRELPF